MASPKATKFVTKVHLRRSSAAKTVSHNLALSVLFLNISRIVRPNVETESKLAWKTATLGQITRQLIKPSSMVAQINVPFYQDLIVLCKI